MNKINLEKFIKGHDLSKEFSLWFDINYNNILGTDS